jgi:hypothetical protein
MAALKFLTKQLDLKLLLMLAIEEEKSQLMTLAQKD